jgi:hypothetical protein
MILPADVGRNPAEAYEVGFASFLPVTPQGA